MAAALAADKRAGIAHLDRHPDAFALRIKSANWDADKPAMRAIKLALEGKHLQAQEIKSELDDVTARKLIDWLWITGRKGTGFVPFIHRFIIDNPDWPNLRLIRSRAERYMYAQGTPLPDVRWYFRDNPPLTPVGKYLYGLALRKTEPERAEKLVRASYRTHRRGAAFSGRLSETFPGWITDEDKFARLSRLILLHETTLAKKNAATMGGPFPKIAAAAHKLLTQAKDAEAVKLALPLRYRYQPALQYALMRYHLRKSRQKVTIRVGKGKKKKKRRVTRYRPEFVRKAMDAMLLATHGHKELPEADKWWKERKGIIHASLSSKKPAFDKQTAYKLAANHGLARGIFLTDAEWMAGWIAMRWLKDAALAERHFRTSLSAAIRTGDKSRAYYWLARSLAKQGDRKEALKHDQLAAGYGFTFYGLLGAGEAGGFANASPLPPSGNKSTQAAMHMRASGRLRALELLVRAGAKRQATQFALQLARGARTRDELAVIMQAVENVGSLPLAMKVARQGAWAGHHVGMPAYPDDPLPSYKHLSPVGPERALVLGIARQESEFDSEAVSHVGARGFMQIMPATGKWLCKLYSLKCSTNQLITRPELNVQLGSAFLYRLVDEWKGSYIMAAAGYNAGSSRVIKWNKTVGDPRKGEIDPVDWIELIPFTETRNYVKRVMRNVQIYRRFLEPQRELSMQDDLDRGRFHPLKTAQNETCGSGSSDRKCVVQD
ncbi:MAG: lytic transglycosylase domain-containing protein [Pseudomonadota bacterium]